MEAESSSGKLVNVYKIKQYCIPKDSILHNKSLDYRYGSLDGISAHRKHQGTEENMTPKN
jgi:hypothetical protein